MCIENHRHQSNIVAGEFNSQGSCEMHQFGPDWVEFSPFYTVPKAVLFTPHRKTVWPTGKKLYYVDPENFKSVLSQRC